MIQCEYSFMSIAPKALMDIAKELKKMNMLKALELKGRIGYDLNVPAEAIDDIIGGHK